MPSEAINRWFRSGQPARIGNLHLALRGNPIIKDTPLSVCRGQAEVYFLKAANGSKHILKLFYDSKRPDDSYLKTVTAILPRSNYFRCGTERKILTKLSLKKTDKTYYSNELKKKLEKAVLMPQVNGMDWASMIDHIRTGKRTLSKTERKKLCANLARIINTLENHKISHRDLSNGNIFIDPATLEMSLIDFDSLYHPNLIMPTITAIGSEGYTAPFISPDKARLTFSSLADRFALAMLCVEFLILNPNSPFSHEGGIFNQDDIYKRRGKTIAYAEKQLRTIYPEALKLFQAAIRSNTFENCPHPNDWITFNPKSRISFTVDSLPKVKIPNQNKILLPSIVLPNDPWENMKGESKNGLILQPSNNHRPLSSANGRPLSFDDTVQIYLRSVARSLSCTINKGCRSAL